MGGGLVANLPPEEEPLQIDCELFEVSRWSEAKRDWGSDYPTFLRPDDPPRFCNRWLQPGIDNTGDAADRPPDLPCLAGWSWISEWRRDPDAAKLTTNGGTHKLCDADGWMYAADISQLPRLHLHRVLPADAPPAYPYLDAASAALQTRPLPVRWRLWVRTRQRDDSAGLARALMAPVGVDCGGWEQEVPEAAILMEGMLARYKESDGEWVVSWALLVRNNSNRNGGNGNNGNHADGKDGGGEAAVGATLLYCTGAESLEVASGSSVLSCPPQRLCTNLFPQIPRELALSIPAAQLRCCFGLGSDAIAEGELHVATSEEERARWVAALAVASARVDEGALFAREAAPPVARQPGQLTVLVLGANGLAATERDGSTDAYVKGTLKGGKRTQTSKTAVIRGTLSPRWDSELVFKNVWSEEAQLLLHIKDWNGMSFNETLGECSFPLRRWDLPISGAPITLVLDLHSVTEGAPRNKKQPQGQLRIQIGWCRNASPQTGARGKVVAASPELAKFSEAAWLGAGGAAGGGANAAGGEAAGLAVSKEESLSKEEIKAKEEAAVANADPAASAKAQAVAASARASHDGVWCSDEPWLPCQPSCSSHSAIPQAAARAVPAWRRLPW